MKAREMLDYFLDHATWVDRASTVDTFKHGDPEVEVRSVAVMWMLTSQAVQKTVRLGANLVITHEPTFYDHHDDLAVVRDDPVYQAKRRSLEDAGLTVLRIHDCWDAWPGIGIGDSLARRLDLTELDGPDPLRRTYHTRPVTLEEFAGFVRQRLGLEAVQVMGEPTRRVTRVGLAFGMLGGIQSMRTFVGMSPDCIVAGELCHWRDVRYLQDAGVALVLTDHAASENPGMESLAEFVEKEFKVPAHYVEVGTPFHTITG